MSQAEYQRGFTEALEYIRRKIERKKDLTDALSVIDDIIVALKEQRFHTLDEALLIVE